MKLILLSLSALAIAVLPSCTESGASAVASPILKTKSAQLSQRDFTPTFTVEQMLKDLGLILGAGLAPLPRGTP